ncbi:DUF4402 domain-containing protein [Parasphingorhabdus flavimaris]|uniref:DUF4402 domain-containing protein n=1 Tax=Parasphingorhabdus flavimaris TaxID=266812 RepID=A0ABX2N5D8_9SPHN|nr:DUF4402 domain-containing protein [Parasphingorhabdus flavimaris]NVD28930.1 DUF4402 domain-containing protein [Parasphingorhabdus flavimaris]|tara:strand:- start:4594 stop:5085 length:492 start_codon:yes stop_codon:yes gene_type:complete
MSKFIKAALASSVLAASVMGANAANAATASADARANILQQVTVTSDGSDLDFGTIVSGAAASTVSVSGGGRSCGAGIVCSGAFSAAGFDVTGTDGETVSVASDPSVTLNSGTNSMTANIVSSVSTMTLTGGVGSFNVGGLLNVGANQADGAYVGTFNVTVNYN